ncbi:uncharacterized protein BYT42DRAFT_550734 [Radiomyces spectabilis]|uniref:uncharacterized protein n=1 Tax=Radiomyces spectabilis TaxID=64574 RepID=UPI00221EB548|nr:uncharacterized protein BYT42DRAFT_550734 [Radiomyces spectabilis]KAI8393352.1 hypothetical protein BYT42DRAFT_550734 [Radiomyces spectabilis]
MNRVLLTLNISGLVFIHAKNPSLFVSLPSNVFNCLFVVFSLPCPSLCSIVASLKPRSQSIQSFAFFIIKLD